MYDPGTAPLVSYSLQKRSVVFDPTTALWAARMVYGEGYGSGKGAAVLWATVNGYLLRRHKYASYLIYIRAFAQPINPKWLPGGSKYKQAQESGNKFNITPNKIARRRRIQNMSWNDLPGPVRNLVTRFATGKVPYPPKFASLQRPWVTNFGSQAGNAARYPWGVGFQSGKRVEWFFEDDNLKTGAVVLRSSGRPFSTPSGGGGAGGVVLLAAGVAALLIAGKR